MRSIAEIQKDISEVEMQRKNLAIKSLALSSELLEAKEALRKKETEEFLNQKLSTSNCVEITRGECHSLFADVLFFTELVKLAKNMAKSRDWKIKFFGKEFIDPHSTRFFAFEPENEIWATDTSMICEPTAIRITKNVLKKDELLITEHLQPTQNQRYKTLNEKVNVQFLQHEGINPKKRKPSSPTKY